jgi:hypothetical protein
MLQFQVSSEVEGMGRYGGERKAKPGHQERIPKPDLEVIRLEEKTGSPVHKVLTESRISLFRTISAGPTAIYKAHIPRFVSN